MKNSSFNWNKHGLLLFVAVTFGVSLSYLGLSYFNHQSRAAALPLLQYLSPDRIETPPKYPICPHLVSATVNGVAMLQDLCTDLYWETSDVTSVNTRDHYTPNDDPTTQLVETTNVPKSVLGNSWYEAMGIDANGNPLRAANGSVIPALCDAPFRVPTPDELLSLAFVPCGTIRYCENSTTVPILCQDDTECGRPTSNFVCSEAYTISCSSDAPSNGECAAKGAGVCVARTDKNYRCLANTCSPITSSFGTYKYTNTTKNPGFDAPITTLNKRLLADGSYWSNKQVDAIQGSQCTAHTGLACASNSTCVGTCGTDRTCSNDKSIFCSTDTQCNFGLCKPFESAVSVNLKYGTINNPVYGKETLMNVRCVYEPPQ